ncbi:MAG TPA: heavy-metal-associated domain-containing protein [Anaerolineales bacterium]|nr:heavy-metal-associated domain-containing protein [Anaerolineales bacterium]
MDENCHVDPIQKTPTAEERRSIYTTLLAIRGMGCPNCAARVRNSLLSLSGVIDADVNHTTGTAQVDFNPNLTTVPALVNAVAQAGGDGRHEYSVWAWDGLTDSLSRASSVA